MNKPLAYIIDLDGTLYDNSHRQHLIPADRSNTAAWAPFNCACADDVLREDVADLVRSILLSGREAIFLTGRGESAREQTMQRLMRDFNFIEDPRLIMRPMDWHTSAAEYKREAMERISNSKRWAAYRFIAIEDDPSIVEVMRGMGITVLHIDSTCCALQAAEVDMAPVQFESLAELYKLNDRETLDGSVTVSRNLLKSAHREILAHAAVNGEGVFTRMVLNGLSLVINGQVGGAGAKSEPHKLVGSGDDLSSHGVGGKS